MKLTEAMGKLVIIGGAEDREGESVILKEFVKLAGDKKARVVVITAATNHPEESGAEMRRFLSVSASERLKSSMCRAAPTLLSTKASNG